MKSNIFICFFLLTFHASFCQDERGIITKIDSINTLALEQYNKSEILKSINSFNLAIKLSDSINDSYGTAVAHFTLGKIYSYMKEYDDAERCFKNMLIASKDVNDNYLIANSYLSLGNVYRNEKKRVNVIPYFKDALVYAQKEDVRDHKNNNDQDNLMFKIRISLSSHLLDMDDATEAHKYILRAENSLDKTDFDAYSQALLSYMYGRYFMKKESLFIANDKFEDAAWLIEDNVTQNKLDDIELKSKIYKDQSLVLSLLGENDKAYAALLKHNSFREKIINEEKIKQENIAKSKFYILEYQRIAQLANKERILQEKVTEEMKKMDFFIAIGVILLLTLLVMLYKNYLSKRKINQILEARNKLLEVARDEAEKSSQLKTNFISNVTHELRTPLYGVVGLTSLLLKSNNLNERDSKFLKSLKFSGDYLLNLVNDILQIGKIESKKLELQIASVNPRILIENIIDSFEYRIQEHNNEVHLSIDDNVPEFIKCDNVRLSQVLINLIGNSIKFTLNGKISIAIEVLDFVKEGVSLRFVIKDNGPGIPEDKHEKIFENFSQLSEKNNIEYQGTGLGLSIAKNLVELFGSKIELVSEVGEGSEFSFSVNFDIDNDIDLESLNKNDDSKTINLQEKYMILVAEDNKINQIVTQNVLEKGNFDCEVVENGLDALNAVRDNDCYDLILMDLNMPKMSGVEATKEIRKFNSKIPIIALTAADIEEVKKDFANIGFDDIITKPFDNFELYQMITSCIQKSKLHILDEAEKLNKVS